MQAKQKETQNLLRDPFPTGEIRKLDFGSADGHRDTLIEDAFVLTSSIKKFLLNKHSIISGSIGSGKSALFKLLKEYSPHLQQFSEHLIVPIEEAIAFDELQNVVTTNFPKREAKSIYPLIWKFQVALRLSEEIANLPNFPDSDNEKLINGFLKSAGGRGGYDSVIERFKNIFENFNYTFEASISKTPIKLKVESKRTTDETQGFTINLDNVLFACLHATRDREYKSPIVIVDKLDRFVAGQEYPIQKNFIEALLEVEDDLITHEINCKIFLRSDLYERLDLSKLGPDKVKDNTLNLRWSEDEIIHFVARRLFRSLEKLGLLNFNSILMTTDLKKYSVQERNSSLLQKLAGKMNRFFRRTTLKDEQLSILERLNNAIVTKVFPRNLQHKNSAGETEPIAIDQFLVTHFRDGHDATTPRYLLIFLKHVQEKAASFYEKNFDYPAKVTDVEGNLEWELFRGESVYEAYTSAKEEYTENIVVADANWREKFTEFNARRGKKQRFEFQWFRKNMGGMSEEETIDFMAYLRVIGFLRLFEFNHDPKRRKYKLPIIYL